MASLEPGLQTLDTHATGDGRVNRYWSANARTSWHVTVLPSTDGRHVYRVESGLPHALTWTIDVTFCFLPILRLNQNLSFQLNKKKFHGERHNMILEGRRGNYERFETISAEGGGLTPERCLRQ